MTIFRFSLLAGSFALCSCASNLPPSDTEIGRLLRIGSNTELEAKFTAYAAARLADRDGLIRELREAGFEKPSYQPARENCTGYVWFGRPWGSLFERGVGIDVCDDTVTVSASYDGL